MGLNDEAEKLAYAWRQLEEAELDSEQYLASFDYIYLSNKAERTKLLEHDAERFVKSGAGDDALLEETPDSDPQ